MLLEFASPSTSNTTKNCTEAELLEDYLNVYMSILLIVGVGGFLVSTVIHNRIICVGRRNEPKQTEIPYLLYGTILFGVGATVWFLFRALGNTTHSNSLIAGEFYDALEIAFILWQFYFIFTVSDVALKSSQLMTVFLMHVAATNCCLWIRITVGEAKERESKLTGRCNQTAFTTVCAYNTTVNNYSSNIQDLGSGSSNPTFQEKVRDIADSAVPFLYPCIAEFCLSASGLILKLWLNQQPQSADQAADNGTDDHNDDSDEDRPLIHPNRQQINRRCSRLCRYATVFATILFSLTLVAMILHIVFDDQNKSFTQPTVIYEVSQIVVISTALTTAIIGLISDGLASKTRDLPAPDPPASDPPAEQEPQIRDHHTKGSHTMVEGALILISVSGLYFAQCLQLNASLNSKYTNNKLHIPSTGPHKISCHTMLRLSSAQSFLTGCLAFFQTLFITQGLTHKIHDGEINQQPTPADDGGNPARNERDHNLTPADRRGTAALVLFICNLTLWMSKTYEMSGLYCNPLYSDFYSSWVQLSDVFYPLWIFYHFHSAATCVNIAWNSFN
ncbi:uncharacterized protein LOC134192436 [Corticium candelabrum]|uniref:uncharacterized protein LOC134192436 n=1 Tax=Corticium candelabrum TaxID=121492 RepID=UPI002E25DB1B|nr:uncharacterized protein LOC134192436 [Corticium candelabrum]